MSAEIDVVRMNGYLDDAIQLILEYSVGLVDVAECEVMGYEWRGVYPALFNQRQYLLAVASVHTAGLEGEVLSVHIRKRKNLRLVIESHYRDNGVRPCALICQTEGPFCSGDFQYSVSSSMFALLQGE